MKQEITINQLTGAVSVGGSVPSLQKRAPKEAVVAALSEFLHSNRDHENGYEWLYFRGLTFGGKPAALSVCFHQGLLREIQWNVILRNETSTHSWPTQAECDQELEFVRSVLRETLGRPFSNGQERFMWGLVWSIYDPRSGFTSSGLRYEA